MSAVYISSSLQTRFYHGANSMNPDQSDLRSYCILEHTQMKGADDQS